MAESPRVPWSPSDGLADGRLTKPPMQTSTRRCWLPRRKEANWRKADLSFAASWESNSVPRVGGLSQGRACELCLGSGTHSSIMRIYPLHTSNGNDLSCAKVNLSIITIRQSIKIVARFPYYCPIPGSLLTLGSLPSDAGPNPSAHLSSVSGVLDATENPETDLTIF